MNIRILTIATVFLLLPTICLASNEYTTNLEEDSNQSWSRADDADFENLSAMTLQAWINRESALTTDEYDVIMTKWITSNRQGYILYYAMDGSTNPYLWLFVYNAATSFDTFKYNVTATTSEWTHVAVTWQGSTKTANFYINSILQKSITGTNVSTTGDDSSAFIIGDRTGGGFAFDGLIDEVKFDNTAWTQAEIAADYACGPDIAKEPLSYWRMENNGNDSMAAANNLTNNNSCTFQSASLPFTDDCAEEEPPTATSSPTRDLLPDTMIYSNDIGMIGHLRQYFATSGDQTVEYEESELRYYPQLYFLFFGICLSIIYLTYRILRS